MKKKILFLMALLAVSLLALAEMTVYVYQKDGTKVEYLAADVDSIGFANVFTIAFDANGGEGSMDVVKVKEGETITLSANTFTKGSSTFTGWNTQVDGLGTAYTDKTSVALVASLTLYAQWETPKDTGIADGHEWVDLGLPSGTKWATMNVGATTPEGYGDYFAWGETTTKSSYTSSNYNYSSHPTTLPLERDAAYVNWGSSWRMPTYDEIDELINTSYTTWTWTTQNGVNGYKVTSKTNGNSIFLPAAGYRYNSYLNSAGSYGFCWSSSLNTDNSSLAYYLRFYSDDVGWYDLYRFNGRTVRPVLRE